MDLALARSIRSFNFIWGSAALNHFFWFLLPLLLVLGERSSHVHDHLLLRNGLPAKQFFRARRINLVLLRSWAAGLATDQLRNRRRL